MVKFVGDGISGAESDDAPHFRPAPSTFEKFDAARDATSAPNEESEGRVDRNVSGFADDGLDGTDGFIADVGIKPAEDRADDAGGALG